MSAGPLMVHAFAYEHEQLCAAMLCELPQMSQVRLARLLARWIPSEAIVAIRQRDDELISVLRGCHGHEKAHVFWRRELDACDLVSLDARLSAARVDVWWRAPVHTACDAKTNMFETLFSDDDEAPAVLFYRGSVSALDHPRAGIVGTREASPHGREFAMSLAKQLAEHDAAVVSGLARGIDSAAHAGALLVKKGPPIAVVGTGLDVVYPTSSRSLWHEVGVRGLLVSERPLGATPNTGAFPARNRIIAQLSMATVVIESRESGGSLITADCAFSRGRPVLVVPGSPLNENCAGSNALLRGGAEGRLALPCLDVSDVLAWLDLAKVTSEGFLDMRPAPNPDGEALLRVMGWESWTTGRLASKSGLDLGALATALAELEQQRWIGRREGRWYRRASEN